MEKIIVIIDIMCVVDSTVKQQPHVLWLDNFSKMYAVAVQNIASGSYSSCLWTGHGVHQYEGPVVDLSLGVRAVRGVPQHLFSEVRVNRTRTAIRLVDAVEKYHVKSICHRYSVNRVPLKPSIPIEEDPVLHHKLQESRDGMRLFHPHAISDINIGSNEGLLSILKNMANDHDALPPTQRRIQILSVDVNIYWRILKVSQYTHIAMYCMWLHIVFFGVTVVPL